jgi:hypothetical protein
MSAQLIAYAKDRYDLHFVFMNTGLEHEKTLEYVNACDKYFGMELAWIETRVHHGMRKGSTYTPTTFQAAARSGEPYESVSAKYGVANHSFRHCTRELKTNPCRAWMREHNLADAKIALGIRVDEFDRMSSDKRFIYPLISTWPTTKQQVLDWWAAMPFDLGLPEHLGNCVGCWKKSARKLALVAQEHPSAIEFFVRLEDSYGMVGPENVKGPDGQGRRSYRQHTKASDVLADTERSLGSDEVPNACEESCEAFGDL